MDKPRIYNADVDIVPDGAVIVDRNTIYGNPYRLGVDGDVAEVTALYVNYLLNNPALIKDIRKNLKGKDLICWCHPDPCHSTLILKLANDPDFDLDALLQG